MRLVTWNCRIGGFHYKAKQVAPFKPDILVVQEVEPLDKVTVFSGDCQPTYRHRDGGPTKARRAIGVFSYTDIAIRSVDEAAPIYGFRRYEALYNGLAFNLIAVWTAATGIPGTSYRQAHEGLAKHALWIRERPTILIGDLNNNASFMGSSWRELRVLLDPLALESAYHHHFGEDFGAETRPTHFHHAKPDAPFHLDYCFVPRAWLPRIRNVQVGVLDPTVSDHVPLIVDLEL